MMINTLNFCDGCENINTMFMELLAHNTENSMILFIWCLMYSTLGVSSNLMTLHEKHRFQYF